MAVKVPMVGLGRGEIDENDIYLTSYRLPYTEIAAPIDQLCQYHGMSLSNVIIALLRHSLPLALKDVEAAGGTLPSPKRGATKPSASAVPKTPKPAKVKPPKPVPQVKVPGAKKVIAPKKVEEEEEVSIPKPKAGFKVKMKMSGGKAK